MGIAKEQDDAGTGGLPTGNTGGTTDTYTATMTPTVTSYDVGQAYSVQFVNGNTGAATINMDGVGVAPVVRADATPLVAGDIEGGQFLILVYDGADFQAIGLTDTATGGTVTSVAALTLGTSGTDLSSSVATSTTTPVITLNVPTASAANRGALSAADWSAFDAKAPGGQLAGVDGSGTDSLVGFSSISTHINRYSYDPNTKVCEQYISFSGTSDNVATTITLPYTSAAYDQNFMVLGVTNNGTTSTVIGRVQIAASSTTATFTRDRTALAWTASGTKTMFGQFNWITA